MPSAIPGPTRPDWRDVFGTEDPDWRIRGNDIAFTPHVPRIVRRLDPDRRMLLSGNAILRETQYNQYTRDRMTIDDTKQYRKISRILNPGPSNRLRHVYQHGRQFADHRQSLPRRAGSHRRRNGPIAGQGYT